MLQIKINKEVKDVKESFVMGLNLRQTIASICAVAIALIIYFTGKSTMNTDILMSIVILCDLPIVCFGFVTYQGMPCEQLIKEVYKSYFLTPKILGNIPVNTYKAIEDDVDYNSPEAVKKRKNTTIKSTIIAVTLLIVLIGSCIGVSMYSQYRAIENYKQEQLTLLLKNYPNECYYSLEIEEINAITGSCKQELSATQDIESIDSILYSTSVRLNAVKTCSEVASEQFKDLYLNNEYIVNNSNLESVINRLSNTILNTTNITETDSAYNNAVEIIDDEIKIIKEMEETKETENKNTEAKKNESDKKKSGSN